MPNQFITTDKVADYALMKFSETATFLKSVNREYDDSFGQKEAKIGDTLRVPVPQHGLVRQGRVASPNPLQTIVRPVKVFGQRGIDVVFNSAEMALDIEELGRRYIDQQIADLVVSIEAEVLSMAIANTPNQTGDPSSPFNELFYANLSKKLIEDNGGFKGTKKMLLNSAGEVQIVDSLKGLFNAQKQLNVQYEEGEMGRAVGFDWTSSTVMPVQATGARSGYLVNGANQSGGTLVVDTGTGAIAKGEVFTIAGVYAVHPQTKQNLGYLRQFVVTDAYAGGGGAVSIYPAIVTSGSEQNVVAGPADNAAIAFDGTANSSYGINLAFTRDAFTFGTVDLPVYPDRPCSRRVYDGVSMRVAQGSDIINDQFIMRFDIMCAFGALRPEWACRIANDVTDLTPA